MIKTGIDKLDQFLIDIKNGIIVDIFGTSGTGKTQLALQISIDMLNDGKQILFQDTTGEFRPERILEMIQDKNLESKLLDQIKVERITNTAEQLTSLSRIKNSNFALIIIDNITELFSFEYSDVEKSFTKNNLFMNYMHDLSSISLQKKLPIIVTNTVRNVEGINVENLDKAISPYTHLKIKLSKNSSHFKAELFSPFTKNNFLYDISSKGLTELS